MAQPGSTAPPASRIERIVADLTRIEVELREIRQLVSQIVSDEHSESEKSLSLPEKSSTDVVERN